MPPTPSLTRVALFSAVAALCLMYAGHVVGGSDEPAYETPGFSPAETAEPGADEMYGFTADDLNQMVPLGIAQALTQRTSLAAIEAGAAAADPLGQTLLCLAYAYGEGVPRDRRRARENCDLAAAANHALALYQLGQMAGDRNDPDASALLDRAAAAGDPRALYEQARQAQAAEEPAEAARLARAAGEHGYAPALVMIGQFYARGETAPQDPILAYAFFKRAGEHGSTEGMRIAGLMVERGFGAAQDFEIARGHLSLASELGDGEASYRAARLYELGLGGKVQVLEARRLYLRAARQGYPGAQAEFDRLSTGT